VTFDRLHHMQLAMPRDEEQAARDFFVGVLGMIEVDKPPVLAARGGAWFRAGSVELHLGVEDDFRAARKGHLGILVTDLDDVVHRLVEAGKDVRWDVDFPGFRRVYAHDPSATGWNSSSPRRRRREAATQGPHHRLGIVD
jgi:catechol 2,3-dioxygenase-like lactoylglutathione lyase family enzyme